MTVALYAWNEYMELIYFYLLLMSLWCLLSLIKVNIIPIIAKSDAISKSELAKFKIKITSELVSNGVQIYQFPTDDETVAEINSTMNVSRSSIESTAVILGCMRTVKY